MWGKRGFCGKAAQLFLVILTQSFLLMFFVVMLQFVREINCSKWEQSTTGMPFAFGKFIGV